GLLLAEQYSAHRIQMHVIASLTQVARRRFINQERFVTAGKKMAAELVSTVKTHGVRAQEPFHPRDQICARSLHNQMKMIAHQTVGMYLPSSLPTGDAECLQKTLSIQIIAKDFFVSIPTAHQVVDCSLVLNSQRPR